MKKKEVLLKKAEKLLVGLAGKAAGMEANTTCPFWSYQPKEPQEVKKLRKF